MQANEVAETKKFNAFASKDSITVISEHELPGSGSGYHIQWCARRSRIFIAVHTARVTFSLSFCSLSRSKCHRIRII